MRFINYLLIAVFLLGGLGLISGKLEIKWVDKEEPKTAEEKTPIDYDKYDKLSAEELQPLAKGGDAEAQGVLAPMYMLGEGVPQDQQKGIELFRLSAAQGNSEFQWLLGATYLLGKGVPQDYQEALKWIRRAAEQGDSRSQFLLGVNYESCDRAPDDYVLAYKWYNLAAEQGDEDCVVQQNIIAKKMTPSQIQEAQRLAREFKPKKESQ